MKQIELASGRIETAFGGTDFGGQEKTDAGRRGLMCECILKLAAGYGDGSTIIGICKELGLLYAGSRPKQVAMRWAFNQLYDRNGRTILERLRLGEKARAKAIAYAHRIGCPHEVDEFR